MKVEPDSHTDPLIGQTIGRLTVLSPTDPNPQGHPRMLCECACGNVTKVKRTSLTQGRTKSCGCLRREEVAKTGKAQSKAILDLSTGETWPSLQAFATEQGVTISSVCHALRRRGRCAGRFLTYVKAWTDYPIEQLGDKPYTEATMREVEILSYDGDKYFRIRVEGVETEVKAGYIYHRKGQISDGPVNAFC